MRVEFSSSFDVGYLEAGKTLLIIPLPDEVVMLVGRVVVAWGGFEARFDQAIESVLKALNRNMLGLAAP